jgi:hypothetical protein
MLDCSDRNADRRGLKKGDEVRNKRDVSFISNVGKSLGNGVESGVSLLFSMPKYPWGGNLIR